MAPEEGVLVRTAISLRDVRKSYGDTEVVKG
jgi:hypothetical protein